MKFSSINGWTIFAHEFFADAYLDLIEYVEAVKRSRPDDFQSTKKAKLLHALLRVIEDIASDPTKPKFRQGSTLGENQKHWFRAKFFAQYRLFFRYDLNTKTIILVWLNDDDTKRAYESKRDAYKVFSRMLKSGNPPSDWEELLEASREPGDVKPLRTKRETSANIPRPVKSKKI